MTILEQILAGLQQKFAGVDTAILTRIATKKAEGVTDETKVNSIVEDSTDAQHGTVHVEAVEHVVHVVVFVFAVKKHFLLAVFAQIFASGHKEASRAAGRVANHIVSAGLHQVNHQLQDHPKKNPLSL